jgi:hypothetical protein
MSKTTTITKRYFLPCTGNYTVEQYNGSSESPDTFNTYGVTTSVVTKGENLPNWMRLIRLGENATTSLSGTVQRVQPLRWGRFTASWSYEPDVPNNTWYKRYGGFAGLLVNSPVLAASNPSTISSRTAEDLALARFDSRVAEVNRQFQGGVFFAELTKTLHGLRHPAEALFKGLEGYSNAAKKLRNRTISKYLKLKKLDDFVGPIDLRALSRKQRRLASREFTKAATGLWLEKTFHWLPLMYDIQGAISALSHTWERLPSEFVKVSATDVQDTAGEYGNHTLGIISARIVTTQKTFASVRMYGRVRIGTRISNWPDSKALGFDVRSFIPTLWELLPYSWAVDYFTNIGDILYGLSYGGQDVLWCARGIKRSIARRHIATNDSREPLVSNGHHTTYYNTIGVTSEVLAEKAIIDRATYTGNYIPLFEWHVPGLSLKWLNLGAVWLQRSV